LSRSTPIGEAFDGGPAPSQALARPLKGGGFDPQRSAELVSERDAYSKTFLNPDGTSTVQLSSMPIHYEGRPGEWLPVDNRVIRAEDGVLTNAANGWRVRFEPMTPKGGVSFATPDGTFRFWARDARPVEPVVGLDGMSVVYPDVLSGLDLTYRIVGSGIEELLVIKSATSTPAVTFAVEGLSFDKSPAGLDARGVGLGEAVSISAPETFDGRSRAVDVSRQVFETAATATGSSVTVGLRSDALEAMPADAFPVTVDPSVNVGVGASWVHSWANYTSNGAAYASYNDGYARIGNPYLSSTSTVRWRSTLFFDYSPYYGASVVDAYLTTTVQSGSGAGARAMYVSSAHQDGFHYGVQARQYPLVGPPSASYVMTSTPFSPASSVDTGTQSHTGSNMWTLYENWLRTGTAGGVMLLTGDESAAYTLKKMAVTLTLTLNRWPANPTGFGSSVTGHTATWWAAPGSDPDGDAVQYNYWVKSNGVVIYSSNWISSLSRTWTIPSAYAGTTLAFGVDHFDGVCWFGECHVTTTGPQNVGSLNGSSPTNAVPQSPRATFVDSLTPTFRIGAATDPDNDSVEYQYRICNQSMWTSSDTSKCISSGWTSALSWAPTASLSPLKWSTTNYWWVDVRDAWLTVTSNTASTFIPQRTAGSHPAIGFGTQPNMRAVADVNTGNGNLTTTAMDLSVPSATTSLDVVRSYNSSSTTPGGFGPGWTSNWERSLMIETDGVSVRAPDGSVEFFGKNPDGTYVTSLGENSVLKQAPLPNVPTAFTSAGWSVTSHDNVVSYFTGSGAYLGFVDTAGRAVTVTTSGNSQTITDTATSRQIYIDWNAAPGSAGSRITGTRTVPIAAHGNTPIEWRYYYDANSRLSKACDPRNNAQTGNCYTYQWDTSNRITSIVLPRGNTQLAVTYDANNRVATRTDGANKTWTFAYASNVTFTNLGGQQVVAALRTTVTNPDNTQDVFDSDVALRSIHTDNLAGLAEHSTYDVGGWVDVVSEDDTTTTNPADTFTEDYTYEPDGDLTSVVDSLGATWSATYTPVSVVVGAPPPNVLATTTDPPPAALPNPGVGVTTSISLNAQGLPTSESTPGRPAEAWTYTAGTESVPGQPGQTQPRALQRTHTDTSGTITTMDYNTAGDLISTVTTTGVTTTWTRDEIGRALTETVTSPAGTRTTTFTYTKLGQTDTVTEARVQNPVTGQWHQARTTTLYDANTNPWSTSIADIEPAAGGFTPDPTRTTTSDYDNNDRVWRITDPEGGVSTVEFDYRGNITKQTDPLGRVTTTSYDSDGRPLVVTAKGYVDPTNPGAPRDVVVSTTTYDEHGRIDTVTDALGNVTADVYDADGQLQTRTLRNYDLRTGGTTNVTLEEHHYLANGDEAYTITDNGRVRTDYAYDSTNGQLRYTKLSNTVPGYTSLDRYTFSCYDAAGRTVGTGTVASSTVPTFDCATAAQRTSYDTYGRVQTSTVENGATDLTTTYTYDPFGRQVTVTDPNGNVTTNTYDILGRLSRTTTPSVAVDVYPNSTATTAPYSEIGYDTFGAASHRRDAAGSITATSYDRNGRPTQATFPAYTPPGSATAITPTELRSYDPSGNVLAFTDRRGQTTNFTYDIFDRVAIQRDPSATTGGTRGEIWNRYDDSGNRVWTRNQEGAVTEFTYDDLGRMRTTTDVVRNATPTPDRYITTMDYDWSGNQTVSINPTSTTEWTAVYSPAGDRLATIDALGYTTTSTYDADGNELTATPPAGCQTRRTFEPAGRLSVTGCYVGATRITGETYTYDSNGNRTGLTTNRGNTTTYTFNSHNQMTSVTTPTASTPIVFTYGYDTRDLPTRTVDGRGSTWWTTYNSWGLEESRIEPATTAHPNLSDRTWTLRYDIAGGVVGEDKPGGVTVTHAFDLLGRVTSDNGGAAGGARTYTYDLASRPTALTANTGTSTMTNTWTDRNQLANVTGTVGNSSFVYDPAGRLSQRVDDAGTTTYNYTARSQLNALADPLTGTTHTYGYNPAGTPIADTITGGPTTLTRTWAVDDAQRTLTDTVTNGAATVATTSYTYDPDSNTLTKTVGPAGYPGAGTNTYTYDPAGRLASWTNPASQATTYGYDANGNLTNNGTIVNTYDQRNRQLTNGATSNTWTPRGTLNTATTGATTTNYTFNGLDQLAAAGTTSYTYDPLGRTQTRHATTFHYSGHHNQPVNDGSTLTTFTPDNSAVATKQSVGLHVLTNTHHDITTTITPAAAVTDTVTYSPWGQTLNRTGTTNLPLGYQSSYTDPTTTSINMGARWYASMVGAFLSRDSYAGTPNKPFSQDRYAYAATQPLNRWDPLGNETMDTAVGRLAHAVIEQKYRETFPRSEIERSYVLGAGRIVGKLDIYDLPRLRYYEIKPNTESGRKSGKSQLKLREQHRPLWNLNTAVVKGRQDIRFTLTADMGAASITFSTHKAFDGLIVYDKKWNRRDPNDQWGRRLTDAVLRELMRRYTNWYMKDKNGPPPTLDPPPQPAPRRTPTPTAPRVPVGVPLIVGLGVVGGMMIGGGSATLLRPM
jgi:RHS repeat-associated protein